MFACFYHGGSSEYDRREDKTQPNKLKDEFKGKALNVDVSLEQDERIPNLTENAKQIDGRKARKKTYLSKMVRKETAMKTLQSERIQNSPVLPFSTSTPSEVNVPRKESITISHSNKTEWQNDGNKNISSLENQIVHQNYLRETAKRETFASLTTQHLRNRRDFDTILESPTESANFTFTINYEDNYRVWNNFSMMYQSRMYRYNQYRVTDDGLQVCNSSDPFIKQRRWGLIAREKEVLASKYCNVSVDAFYYSNYTLYRNFTVFFKPTEQSFTRQDYGVTFGYFAICSAKLSLSCKDYLVKVKYGDQYNVFQNFSLFTNNRMYDYHEYQFGNDSLEMCAANDSRIRAIWRTRNSWEQLKDQYTCRGSVDKLSDARYYTVNKHFTVYLATRSQYFTRNNYGVKYGKPYICREKLRPTSTEYTQEDLLMCNDSIINIKYDEYKVRNDFSILYKNKVYDYTEYRVLDDGITICNSTDNHVGNTWKARNKWIKATNHRKSCNKPIRTFRFNREYYTVNKQFTVFYALRRQYFTRNDYGVKYGKPYICKEKLRPISTEYTQEDLLMCNDSIINIKHDDEYKVRTDFSILYKNKVYDYTEYRVLNDSIKICNSTDNYVRNIWKVRNKWIKATNHRKSCNKPIRTFRFNREYYTVNKQFTVFYALRRQYFTRNDYGVKYGKPYICKEKLRPISTEYTQEDLLMCNDSIINIKHDDEYKVRTDFSILYKNKVYDYTEYRVLNDSIKICNSTDNYVRNIWKVRNKWIKATNHRKSCNKPIRTFRFNREYYTVNKQFTVFYALRRQYFTRNDYGVKYGKPYICKEKLRPISTEYTQEDLLMCNDSIINIKYDEKYKIRTDFSILHENKMYDYTEYRVLNDGIKICNSTDNYVRNIWKIRNKWVKATIHQKSCNKPIRTAWFDRKFYTVNKQSTVYLVARSQHFTRNAYGVEAGKFAICKEKVKPISTEYTQKDLLMCNDSIISIKYDDEYKVRTDFSILYKNKVYNYTEYRVLNDSIRICNSTDNYVGNIWKVRNKWVKETMHQKTCNKPIRTFWPYRKYYTVNKQFTVYFAARSQYFTRNDYGVKDAQHYICDEKLRTMSTEYTKEDLLMCNDSIINIKYDEKYKIRTDFSILHKNKMYDYTEYRVLNDGIKICNSTDNYVRNIWKIRNKWVKATIHQKSCNKPIRTAWFDRKFYTVNKQSTVYLVARSQHFTRNAYGVEAGKFAICKEKVKPISTEYTQEDILMCNDSIINIKYDDEYKIRTDFSILHKNKIYDYTEYRVLNDSIKICNATDTYVRNIWKVRNKWVKKTIHQKSCNKPIRTAWFDRKIYTVNKQSTVYLVARSQHFTRNAYGVEAGKFAICKENVKPISTEYTQEDILMCNDSIINIKYDDEYKIRTDFSVLYKNKVYDYTEYRVLNDSIRICNSTDNYVRNIWKVRNKWVKAKIHQRRCNKPITESWIRNYYTVNKQFTVYLGRRGQYFTRNEYGVEDGKPFTCDEKLRSESTDYTQEDLLMCNDSIINIKYDDEYKIRTDFSILYKNKVYDYTEYRVLNDSIRICNSTDNYVRNIWKVRNKWVKAKIHQRRCNKPITESWIRNYYTVNKQFTVYLGRRGQYFTRNEYGVEDGKPFTCDEKLRSESTEYTQEDLLMCNDSIINITYHEKYKIRTDFSILHKNKMYDYTEYRVLNDSIKICNATDTYVRNIWKVRNKWVKKTIHQKSCNKPIRTAWFDRKFYTVNKQSTVYLVARSQHFTRNAYGVEAGKFAICKENVKPISTEYTQEDILMCNDSIINIKYDDEYKIRTDFSILYKNKVYDYTEYRVLNDSTKICNSTDNYVRNIWKVRNKWVKAKIHQKSCYNQIKES
ncbi:Hypothetical predicted protein [Paramuricea clavata]|uniref:Uncharacterized protein n=1 Tax=Paramuricea clavata TaxID=317549 RepID=A0A6S7IFJ1_PARCT|nr:Hypothetical predicted protein [Paramuricea clavata]